jgi:hypothetical protein
VLIVQTVLQYCIWLEELHKGNGCSYRVCAEMVLQWRCVVYSTAVDCCSTFRHKLIDRERYVTANNVRMEESIIGHSSGIWLHTGSHNVTNRVTPNGTDAHIHVLWNLGSRTPLITNKFSEQETSWVTNGVSSNEHASRQQRLAASWEYRWESVSCSATFAQYIAAGIGRAFSWILCFVGFFLIY